MRKLVCLLILLLGGSATLPSHAPAQVPIGPTTCVTGMVPRKAYHGDTVCVPPAERDRVADDNALASGRISPGPYGPKQCKNGFKWRLSRPDDLVCVTVDEFNLVQKQNQLAPTRYAINGGTNPNGLPEAMRPGDHTMVLRPTFANVNNSIHSHKGYAFVGVFINADLDCEHTAHLVTRGTGTGASLALPAGWGQVMGGGVPGTGKDPCFSWITQAAVDFDLNAIKFVPIGGLKTATLSYNEAQASACAGVQNQGALAPTMVPCYSNGQGSPEAKPDGCVILSIPSSDWEGHPPPGPLQTVPGQFPKIGKSAWNVTNLVNYRVNPITQPINYNKSLLGHGFMLLGPQILASRLAARDNTRCTSTLSDIKLTLTYNIPTPTPPTILK